MADNTELCADGVAQIGLMFLDGDTLEKAIIDKIGQVDYDFGYFNQVKSVVSKIEKINPALGLTAVIWQRSLENYRLMHPVVAGNALPREGHAYAVMNERAKAAFDGGFGEVLDRDGIRSHYYPIRNSDYEIIGALELIEGKRVAVDI